MDKGIDVKETQERSFNSGLDCAPLEHVLIGSTVNVGGLFINSDSLRTRPDVAVNRELLLKPCGLTNRETTVEETRRGREKKEEEPAWYACFMAPVEVMIGGYNFIYELKSPDSEGMIPNSFTFKMTNDSHTWTSLNPDDVSALEGIVLGDAFLSKTEDESPLFSLSKDVEKGLVTLEYLPLKEQTSQ